MANNELLPVTDSERTELAFIVWTEAGNCVSNSREVFDSMDKYRTRLPRQAHPSIDGAYKAADAILARHRLATTDNADLVGALREIVEATKYVENKYASDANKIARLALARTEQQP